MTEENPENRADKIGGVIKRAETTLSFWSIFPQIAFSLVLLTISLYFRSTGVTPFFWFLLVFFVISLILPLLSIISYVRVKKISPDATPLTTLPPGANEIILDEKLLFHLGGITKTGFANYGVAILGAGTNKHPENAILVTNKRIIFIYVPFEYGDKFVDGVDVHGMQFMFAQKAIDEKLESIVNSETLEKIILKYSRLILPLEKTKESFSPLLLGFIQNLSVNFSCDGKKYGYGVITKDKLNQLKECFNSINAIS